MSLSLSRGLFLVATALLTAFVAFRMYGEPKLPRKRVIIVGGGLAGLSAAIEAHKAGARVLVLEQEKMLGGNSAKASSGINGVPSPAQDAQGIADSVDAFIADTKRAGRGREQSELVELLAHESKSALEFLESEAGLNLSVVTIMGGHSAARSHRAVITGRPMNVGLAIMSAMEKSMRKNDDIEIRTNVLVTNLLRNPSGVISGVTLDIDGQLFEGIFMFAFMNSYLFN